MKKIVLILGLLLSFAFTGIVFGGQVNTSTSTFNQLDIQQIQQNLINLEQMQTTLLNQISQLNQDIENINAKIDSIHATLNKPKSSKINELIDPYVKFLQDNLSENVILVLIALTIFLLLWLLFTKNSKKQPVAEESDYDFLGSQEGINAKLDLARAYIDMGDTKKSQEILNEIITRGNEEQKNAARKLLDQIKK